MPSRRVRVGRGLEILLIAQSYPKWRELGVAFSLDLEWVLKLDCESLANVIYKHGPHLYELFPLLSHLPIPKGKIHIHMLLHLFFWPKMLKKVCIKCKPYSRTRTVVKGWVCAVCSPKTRKVLSIEGPQALLDDFAKIVRYDRSWTDTSPCSF